MSGLLVVACGGKDDPAATEGGSATDTEGGTETDPVTATDPSGGSNSGGNACIPGVSVACVCPNGSDGAQVCAPDGKSFGGCECEGASGSASSASTLTTLTTDPMVTTTDVTISTSDVTATDATATDATTTDDTTTGDGTTTADTTTGANVCNDPGPEPNEDEDSADDLGDQTCGAMIGTITGVLDGDADTDWSMFHTIDGQGCGFENPFVELTLTASDAVRLCVFADCDNGTADFNCPMGTMDATSPGDLPGCCSNGDITFQFNCSGSPNESADFFVRVDQAPADACVDYSVGYDWGPQ